MYIPLVAWSLPGTLGTEPFVVSACRATRRLLGASLVSVPLTVISHPASCSRHRIQLFFCPLCCATAAYTNPVGTSLSYKPQLFTLLVLCCPQNLTVFRLFPALEVLRRAFQAGLVVTPHPDHVNHALLSMLDGTWPYATLNVAVRALLGGIWSNDSSLCKHKHCNTARENEISINVLVLMMCIWQKCSDENAQQYWTF